MNVRIAIAHEWLVRYAGSERVVHEILAEFPRSPLVTTFVNPDAVPAELAQAKPSFLQHVPGATRRHEWFLPLMPLSWRLREPVDDVDVVVSSSHACAKAVRIAPGIPHLCYCHTPMRYAWQLEAESGRFPRALRGAARLAAGRVRNWDRRTAGNVTRFVANSHAVAERIRRFYGRDASVIHPPVRTDFFTPNGKLERNDAFLFVGRLVSYKRPDLVVAAFAELPYRLAVVGAGHLRDELVRRATPNVSFIEHVDDNELRDLYRNARALVVPGEEDFGIITAEALACGTPVVAFDRGGSADIVEDGVSGLLYEGDDVEALRAAIRRAAGETFDAAEIRGRAERFSPRRFRREIRAAVEELAAESPVS